MKRKLSEITSSLDVDQPIYISERTRKELFDYVLNKELSCTNEEDKKDWLKYAFSAENLARYCLGSTGRADYAYSHISKLLKKEYGDYKLKVKGERAKWLKILFM